jgi:acyl transferase domain-containing protein/acyl-CoA synthetase (AMP-forming)/AMP-acid ligase II/alpha-beta hydrolase superfamily lysophospholipase/acyl carrier protein
MKQAAFSCNTLIDVLKLRAESQAEEPAYHFLRDDGRRDTITYAQLDCAARSTGRNLANRGFAGQPVVLLYPPGLDYISAFFGCLYAGAIAVPAFPPHPRRPMTRLKAMLADSLAPVALTTTTMMASLQKRIEQDTDLNALTWIESDQIPVDMANSWTHPAISADSLAFLQYTSGSTGAPKGVMVSHGNLIHNLKFIHRGFDIDSDGVGVTWLPIYHDMGLVGGILEPLFAGGPATLISPVSFLQRPLIWLQAISEYGGTISGGPNFAYQLCVDRITATQRDELDLSSWRTAYCGAEPLRWDTLKRFADAFAPCGFRLESFYPCYGLAESTLMVTGGSVGSAPRLLSVGKSDLMNHKVRILSDGDPKSAVTLVGCGTSSPDQQVAIVDPDSRKRRDELQVGEIWVRGPSVAKGYWGHDAANEETFQGVPAEATDGPYLRTGDLGFVHDGELYVTGRLKDLIIIRGRNHYPQDIEQTVETCDAALRPAGCAAFAVEIGGQDRLVVVQEVERRTAEQNLDSLLQTIRQAVVLEHEVDPYEILLVKMLSVPKTSSGKVQRHVCRQQYLDDALSVVGRWGWDSAPPEQPPAGSSLSCSAPSTNATKAQIEAWLVTAIAQRLKLGMGEIDARRPFDTLGLDSMAAVQVCSDLETWLGRRLSPALIFEFPDIDSLARHLAKGRAEDGRHRNGEMPQPYAEPIAIVGIGCRFPGNAGAPETYWRLLASGVDAISEVPPDRWDIDAYYDPDPDAPSKMSTRWGGFLNGVDLFDPNFFGITPREAQSMDPQQRLLLEVGWQALEDAGISPEKLAGTLTGVFMGLCNNDYSRLLQATGLASQIDAYYGTGTAFSVAAGRLSYVFGLQGPNLSVDTACSSSLVAIHLACQSLLRNECHVALAGGVNLLLSPDAMIYFSKVRAMAADGRCKTFDAAADGYVRGEGCGIVVLKRLSQAVADGDRIQALIRGSAINHDGCSNGLTAPNPAAQERVIRQALAAAGVDGHQVGYVEAHGTGTALGDPIEVRALHAALATDRPRDQRLMVGSVKTNIGHLEAAAGVAGLIKTVLVLHHGAVPSHLHFRQPNPQIAMDNIPISIPTCLTPWATSGSGRIAGVSSFGFSGTNAHIILEAAPSFAPSHAPAERSAHLFSLSAKSMEALEGLRDAYVSRLGEANDLPVADVCHTAGIGRSHFSHRLAVTTTSTQELRDKLASWTSGRPAAGIAQGQTPRRPPQIAFVFAGRSCLQHELGRQLCQTQPTFRRSVEECDQLVRPHLNASLFEIMIGRPVDPSVMGQAAIVQPLLFAFEYALAELWRSWGIEPAIVMGHRLGEYVAACVAGVYSLEDGLKLMTRQGRLIDERCSAGCMTTGEADADEVAADLAPLAESVSIAAVNGPLLEEWEKEVAAVHLRDPTMRIISSVTGKLVQPQEMVAAGYWRRHLRETVQFAAGADAIAREGCEFALEIGPAATLHAMSTMGADSGKLVWLPSVRPGHDAWQSLFDALGRLYVAGVDVDWAGVDRDYPRRRVSLPTYPFHGTRYWLTPASAEAELERSPPPHRGDDALRLSQEVGTDDVLYEVRWVEASTETPAVEHRAAPAARSDQAGGSGPGQNRPNWIIFADSGGVGDLLAARLATQGAFCTKVFAGDAYREHPRQTVTVRPAAKEDVLRVLELASRQSMVDGIIYLWGLHREPAVGPRDEDMTTAIQNRCGAVLHLVQGLSERHAILQSGFWLIAAGSEVDSLTPCQMPARIAQSALWGLGNAIGQEHPELRCTRVDLETADAEGSADAIFHVVTTTQNGNGRASELAYRNGKRHVKRLARAAYGSSSDGTSRLEEHRSHAEDRRELAIRPDGTYLVTGGTGALGQLTAEWLVQQGARHLLLASRSDPGDAARTAMQQWEQAGVAVSHRRVDVGCRQRLAELLREMDDRLPPLAGVVHCAGVRDDCEISAQDWPRFEEALRAKAIGAWYLHEMTKDRPLDFFVTYSSVASLLALPGAAGYAAANSCLDALAHHRRQSGLAALSINWGPWKQTGMAANGQLQKAWAALGVRALEPERCLTLLGRLLRSHAVQMVVLDVDWSRFVARSGAQVSPVLDEPVTACVPPCQAADRSPDGNGRLPQQIRSAPRILRPGLLSIYLRRQFAEAMELEADAIALDGDLAELGLDSLMTMSVIGNINRDFQLTFYPREFYQRRSITALAAYLADELEESRGKTAESGAKSTERITASVNVLNHRPQPRPPLTGPRVRDGVFILSAPRSGSTLLRVMLAGHAQVFSPPELHLLPFDTMAERQRILSTSHLGEGLTRAVMELQELDPETARGEVQQWIDDDRPIDQIYRLLQSLAAPRRLVDKSPSYSGSLETLQRSEVWFEDAKYVFLARHPLSVIESLVRMRMEKLIADGDHDSYGLAETIWRVANQNVIRFLETIAPDRKLALSYESLVTNPEREMRRVAAFLDIRYDPALVTPYDGRRMTEAVVAGAAPIDDPNFLRHDRIDAALADAWRDVRLPRPLVRETVELASQLGYRMGDAATRKATAEEETRSPSQASASGTSQTRLHVSRDALRNGAPMREEFLRANGLSLCLCQWGRSDAPIVLCLHGILDQGAHWQRVAARLIESGFRVIAPDFRGHGRSDHIPAGCAYHLVDFVSDADAVLRHLGEEPVILAAHSLGAAVASLLAIARPERISRVIAVEPPLGDARFDDHKQRLTGYLDHLAATPVHTALSDVSEAAERLRRVTPAMSQELAEALARRSTKGTADGLTWAWDARLRTRGVWEFARDYLASSILADLAMPVTLIFGRQSQLAHSEPWERMASQVSECRVIEGGHHLTIEAADEVAAAIASAATRHSKIRAK